MTRISTKVTRRLKENLLHFIINAHLYCLPSINLFSHSLHFVSTLQISSSPLFIPFSSSLKCIPFIHKMSNEQRQMWANKKFHTWYFHSSFKVSSISNPNSKYKYKTQHNIGFKFESAIQIQNTMHPNTNTKVQNTI